MGSLVIVVQCKKQMKKSIKPSVSSFQWQHLLHIPEWGWNPSHSIQGRKGEKKKSHSNHYCIRPLFLILPDVRWPEEAEVRWWRRWWWCWGLNRQVQGHLLRIHPGEEVGDSLLLHRTRRALLSSGAEVQGRGEAEEALPIALGEALTRRRGSCWRLASFLGSRRANSPGV